MIKINGLQKYYRAGNDQLHVLKNIDLEVAAGEMVAVMGPSGSGKSTLLNIIGLLDGFDSGSYTLGETPMVNLSESQASSLRNQRLGFVFQSFNLLPFKTAIENVALPLYYQKTPRKKRLQRSQALLERLSVGALADRLPGEMSGGQKQRVAIARALVTEPQVVLADEPTGALDSVTSSEVLEILQEIHRSGKTVVLVTHDEQIAAPADRLITLVDGEIKTGVQE